MRSKKEFRVVRYLSHSDNEVLQRKNASAKDRDFAQDSVEPVASASASMTDRVRRPGIGPDVRFLQEGMKVRLASRMDWKQWFVVPALIIVVLVIGGLVTIDVQTAAPNVLDSPSPHHRIVFQVNADDPIHMKHAVSNSNMRYYTELGETARVEIVAYGDGIKMFRADTSPVRNILEFVRWKRAGPMFAPEPRLRVTLTIFQRRGYASADGGSIF